MTDFSNAATRNFLIGMVTGAKPGHVIKHGVHFLAVFIQRLARHRTNHTSVDAILKIDFMSGARIVSRKLRSHAHIWSTQRHGAAVDVTTIAIQAVTHIVRHQLLAVTQQLQPVDQFRCIGVIQQIGITRRIEHGWFNRFDRHGCTQLMHLAGCDRLSLIPPMRTHKCHDFRQLLIRQNSICRHAKPVWRSTGQWGGRTGENHVNQ